MELELPKLASPSNGELQAMTEALEKVFSQQSAMGMGQLEVRRGIATELHQILHHELPGI